VSLVRAVYEESEHRRSLTFAAQIILHFVVIAGEIKSQNSLLRNKNQAQFQIRPALKSVRRDFSDADPAVNVRPAKPRLDFPQRFKHIGFLARDALAKAGRRFNLARH
jgi:hypothetical protein